MLTFFQPPKAMGLAGSTSPPCMKLDTWLRIANIPHEAGAWPLAKQGPKGKIPFVEDDGVVMGDSTLIIEHLKRTRKVDPDEALSTSERAISLAFRRMIKEHLSWVINYFRYRDPAGWAVFRISLGSFFVAPGGSEEDTQRGLAIADNIQKLVHSQLEAQGLGRHSDEEVHALGSADVNAIADFLGDKAFFMGDKPTTADAAVYAYMANIIEPPIDNATVQTARGRANLVDYCGRMRARFFGG